jgi:hypothetical protein
MKRIIRLTESDLTRIVKRVIRENFDQEKMNKLIVEANALIQPAAGLTFSIEYNKKPGYSFGIDKISLGTSADKSGLAINFSTYGAMRYTSAINLISDGKNVFISAGSAQKTGNLIPNIENLRLVLEGSLSREIKLTANTEKNIKSLTTFLTAINAVINKYKTSGIATAS